MFESLSKSFVDMIHSKRAWAIAVALIGVVVKEFFPEHAETIYAAIGVISMWVLGESIRPVADKGLKK
jgi:tetrahydromethanopterin S-methyltransferase subunit C